MQTKQNVDRVVRTILLISASFSIIIVISIFVFIFRSSLPAFSAFGLNGLLGQLTWRPANGSFGILAMIVGSVMVTLMALVIGVPLAIAAAIFLAEIAPRSVQAVVRPAVQLLAGIPSVVYGLFGMVVLVPLIRRIPVAGNSGYGLLSAAIVLAVMILPTITSISEDAIRAVPRSYKEASLALGATHLQTIFQVLLPAGKSGIGAALILGIGRALGETMAMIMVIGNSVILPAPLDDNPLTIFLSQARTLTGNIAVEINYASGLHASALFATGVVLFVLIMIVNVSAHAILNRSTASAS